MNAQICIQANTGQDCLEFTRTGSGPSKGWNLVQVKSKAQVKSEILQNISLDSGSVNPSPYYATNTAHTIMI